MNTSIKHCALYITYHTRDRFTCDDLAWFTEQLSGLKSFLDDYAPLSLSELPTDSPHRAGPTGGRVQVRLLWFL